MTDIQQIELEQIRIDGGTQPRKQVYEETVVNYTELLLEGVKMPPIVVFNDGKTYWLADGFHRYHAHKRASYKTVECEVHTGTKRDAFIFSRGANAEHGMPRTNEEKRLVVLSLLDDIEFADCSERDIAKICKVSHMTVNRIKKALELNKKQKLPPPPKKAEAPSFEQPEAPTEDDKMTEMATELQAMAEENAKLKDKLAIIDMDVSDDAKIQVEMTIEELRARIRELETQLNAVTLSRNDFQNKCAEAIKQANYWKKRAERSEKSKQ